MENMDMLMDQDILKMKHRLLVSFQNGLGYLMERNQRRNKEKKKHNAYFNNWRGWVYRV
jgi:hypothetical protein